MDIYRIMLHIVMSFVFFKFSKAERVPAIQEKNIFFMYLTICWVLGTDCIALVRPEPNHQLIYEVKTPDHSTKEKVLM